MQLSVDSFDRNANQKMPDSEFQFISFASASEVDHWERAEETPTGTREKFTLIEPGTVNHYIFKYPKEYIEHQIWSELLASIIAGGPLNWEVQHTGIAVLVGRPGNLLRYIYSPKNRALAKRYSLKGIGFVRRSIRNLTGSRELGTRYRSCCVLATN